MTPSRTPGSSVQCRAAHATAAALVGVAAIHRVVLLYALFGARLGFAVAVAVHVGVVPGHNVVGARRWVAAATLRNDTREVAYW